MSKMKNTFPKNLYIKIHSKHMKHVFRDNGVRRHSLQVALNKK